MLLLQGQNIVISQGAFLTLQSPFFNILLTIFGTLAITKCRINRPRLQYNTLPAGLA